MSGQTNLVFSQQNGITVATLGRYYPNCHIYGTISPQADGKFAVSFIGWHGESASLPPVADIHAGKLALFTYMRERGGNGIRNYGGTEPWHRGKRA